MFASPLICLAQSWVIRPCLLHCSQEHWCFLRRCPYHEEPRAAHVSCGISLHSLHRQNQTPARSKKHGNNGKRLCDFATRSRKWPTVRRIRPSTNTTPESAKLRSPSGDKDYETGTHHACYDRTALVVSQAAHRVKTVTFHLQQPSRSSSAVPGRTNEPTPANSFATLCWCSPAGRTAQQSQDDRAFSHAAPCLWNNLPLAMGVTDSQKLFKNQLKTILFKRAFLFKLLHWHFNSWHGLS